MLLLQVYEMFGILMSDNVSGLPDSQTLDIRISGSYEQIFDELQGYLSELPDSHTLDIEISGLYE